MTAEKDSESSNAILLAKIDDRLEHLQSDILPGMQKEIREARDGSIANNADIQGLNIQIETIRDTTHNCVQAKTIGSLEQAIKIFITVAALLLVPSGAYIFNDVRADSAIDNLVKNNATAIKNNATAITKIGDENQKQLKIIQTKINSIPNEVQTKLNQNQWDELSDDEFESYIHPLSNPEKRRMRLMWRRARLLRESD